MTDTAWSVMRRGDEERREPVPTYDGEQKYLLDLRNYDFIED